MMKLSVKERREAAANIRISDGDWRLVADLIRFDLSPKQSSFRLYREHGIKISLCESTSSSTPARPEAAIFTRTCAVRYPTASITEAARIGEINSKT